MGAPRAESIKRSKCVACGSCTLRIEANPASEAWRFRVRAGTGEMRVEVGDLG